MRAIFKALLGLQESNVHSGKLVQLGLTPQGSLRAVNQPIYQGIAMVVTFARGRQASHFSHRVLRRRALLAAPWTY